MVDVVFPSGRQGWLTGVRGEVCGLKKWSETHVTSTPGKVSTSPAIFAGGSNSSYLHQPQVHYTPPEVRSRNVTRSEFWIRPASGHEVKVTDLLSVRDGHDVVLLWGNAAGRTSGHNLYFHNYTTGTSTLLNQPTIWDGPGFVKSYKRQAIRRLRSQWLLWSAALIAVILLVGVAVSVPFWWYLFLIPSPFAAFVVARLQVRPTMQRLHDQMSQEMRQVADGVR